LIERRSVHYARRLHRSYVKHAETLIRNFYSAAASQVSALLAMTLDAKSSGKMAVCEVTALGMFFHLAYDTPTSDHQIALRRIQCLRFYIERESVFPLWPVVPRAHLDLSMRESASRVLFQADFSPHGFFDDIFAFWLIASGEMSEFDSAIEAAAELKNGKINLSLLSEVVGKFIAMFHPIDGAEKAVIKHAVYRFFFDRLFMIHPELLIVKEDQMTKLMLGCHHLKWATPNAMIIPETLMKPEMMNQAFSSIVQKNHQLEEAVRLIGSIQFLVNPMEILAVIFQAIKTGEEFVRQNRMSNRFGEFMGMFEKQKVPGVGGQLAFDEFFPLFCLMFAAAAPSNAPAVVEFLGNLVGLAIPPAFQFAKMSFATVVQYIEEMKESELQFEPINEDEDPLGLLKRQSHKAGLKG
jgi:hypothetical protein